MPKSALPKQSEIELFSLKLNKVKSLRPRKKAHPANNLVALRQMEPAPGIRSSQYRASINILGQSDRPVTGKLFGNGQHFASILLADTGFTFDALFNNFISELTRQFVFDDTIIQLYQKPGEQVANFLDFTGKLRLDSLLLQPFKSFLQLPQGLVLNGLIPNGGQDLASKIVPVDFTLASSNELFFRITDNISTSNASFQVVVRRRPDVAANQISWEIAPTASGLLTINNLAARPVILNARIAYDAGVLSVNAFSELTSGLFGMDNLNLENFNISFLAAANPEIDISATFKTAISVFDFRGKLSPTNGFMLAVAEQFTVDDLNDIFRQIFGVRLAMPDFDVVFQQVIICLATRKTVLEDRTIEPGLTISCSIVIHGITCDVSARISSDGIYFSGALTSFEIGPVQISEVLFSMNFHNSSTGKASECSLQGLARIQNVDVTCKVAFEKQNNVWNTLVYGKLSSDSFLLSHIFPTVNDSALNTLRFSRAAFVFATQDCTAQDADFLLPVKQGLQLVGTIDDFPALANLTRGRKSSIQLAAFFGNTVGMSLAIAETRLDLAPSVSAEPISISVQLAPLPELNFLFGINVTIPGQSTPLHFDLKLALGIPGASASGTMKGYWDNPFGVRGLKIGPALALELNINYVQFFSTGTPSGFGIAGGIMLGDVTANMALCIAGDPSKQILQGEIMQLSSKNLIKFVSTATGINFDPNAVPDFFQLNQLRLYCAPTGGMIGTISYQQGFSFAGSLALFGKELSVFAALSSDGLLLKGELDRLDIGPLTIKGQRGKNARLDLQLSLMKQAFIIDGAIDFIGISSGLYAEISKKGIDFSFEVGVIEQLKLTINGKSEGSFSDLSKIDFRLSGVFENSLSQYLQNDIARKITDVLNSANSSLEMLQKDLSKKEAEFKAVFKTASDAFIKARHDADKAINQAQKKVDEEKRKWTVMVTEAQKNLDEAELAYNKAFTEASRAVQEAEARYNKAFRDAENELRKAQKNYNEALSFAQKQLGVAKRNYDKSFGGIESTLNNAQKIVNSIDKKIDSLKRELRNLEGWEQFKGPGLILQIEVLKASKAAATGALNLAKEAVKAFKNTSSAIAFSAANTALNIVKTTGEAAVLKTAENVVRTIRQGGDYVAFEAAKKTLAGIRSSSRYTIWQGADSALELAKTTGRAVLTQAENALEHIAETSVFIALEMAKNALKLVENGPAAVLFHEAKMALEALQAGTEVLAKFVLFTSKNLGNIIDLKKVKVSASLKHIQQGKFFEAEIELVLMGKPSVWKLDFNPGNIAGLIQSIFTRALSEAKAIMIPA